MFYMLDKIFKNQSAKHACYIGALSAASYLACYFCKNILSVVSPHIVETSDITVAFIGTLSTFNMIFYAIGQLVNGIIGDKVKAKYLVSIGLLLSGVCSLFMTATEQPIVMIIAYSLIGFFLSMLYAPLVKVIAENTHPSHALRCCLALTFASLFGVPLAGVASMLLQWQNVFRLCGFFLVIVGIACFCVLSLFEQKRIVTYKERKRESTKSGSIKVLFEYEIVKFTFVAVLTGIVRTSVVFWVPTYLTQYLGFSAGTAASIFTIMSFVQSASPYVNNLILYEQILKRNINVMLLLSFSLSTISFVMMFTVHHPFVNIIFLILALMTSNGASEMLWSVYCPSLRDTGMVSSATGYLDFMSYVAAGIANILFANAISQIGWGTLILVWALLMFAGVLISLPLKKKKWRFFLWKHKEKNEY